MPEVQNTRMCATPTCRTPVTNPQSGYCDSCLEFDQLTYDLETARFQQELADEDLQRLMQGD